MKLAFLLFMWLILTAPISMLAVADDDFREIRPIQKGHLSQSETLSILDKVFATSRVEYLSKISTSKFMQSRWYSVFKRYISQGRRINLNYRTEVATQAYVINDDDNHLLFVDFERSRVDNKWYVAGAYIMKHGRKKSVEGYGFTPNDININFSGFAKELTGGTGLYKQIKRILPPKYKISPAWEKTLRMNDVIIYDSYGKEERIFLTLRYYPSGQPEDSSYKSGWLIDEGGTQHFVLNEPNKDTAYINIPALSGRENIPQQATVNQQALGSLAKIQCNNVAGEYIKVTLSWQGKKWFSTGASVPINSIIRNPKSLVKDRKIILIGEHNNLTMATKCDEWLNLSSSVGENRELTFKLSPFNYRINRSASNVFVYLYY